MTPDHVFKVINILIYPAVIDKNIIHTIRQTLAKNFKPVTNREQASLWILLRRVWFLLYKSRILW